MAKKRVTIKKIGNGYLVNYGGDVRDIARTKKDATKKANSLRKKLNRTRR